MINNDVLRSIRYMLDLGDGQVAQIVRLADPHFPIDTAAVQSFLKKEGEAGYVECGDPVLAHFLDGLVIHKRGSNPDLPLRPAERRVTNNVVLKKLRVAFALRDVDVHQAFEAAGFAVSVPEVTALFRKPGQQNYRACGDQMLRNFLKGLTLRVRVAPMEHKRQDPGA